MFRFAALRSLIPAVLIALAGAALLPIAGCSKPGTPASAASPSSASAAASEAAASQALQQYQQMLAMSDAVTAASIGEGIVRKYPETSAAAEVQKSLPQVEARAQAETRQRLANLWNYATANDAGLEHTASIYTSEPAGANVQLILRRHVYWGQSVYLFGTGHGFVCKPTCDVVMYFDGQREVWKAYPPQTGEPAIFIKNDQAFIAALEKAQIITMKVVTKDHGQETLKFEVGGFNPANFPPLPKHKK